MKLLNRFIDKAEYAIAYIAGVTLLIMMLLIFFDVSSRSIFGISIRGTLDITGEYLMVIIIYLSISYTQKHKEHISVELFRNKFGDKVNNVFGIFSNILAIACLSILGYSNLLRGIDRFTNDIRSAGILDYPIAPAFFIISIGIFFLIIRLVIDTGQIIKGIRNT